MPHIYGCVRVVLGRFGAAHHNRSWEHHLFRRCVKRINGTLQDDYFLTLRSVKYEDEHHD